MAARLSMQFGRVPWKRWLKLFNAYLVSVGGGDWSAERKAALLLTSLGAEGQRQYFNNEDVKQATAVSVPADATSTAPQPQVSTAARRTGASDEYTKLLNNLNLLFEDATNFIVERHQFCRRLQLPGEPFTQYVAELKLALTCEFVSTFDEGIRDQVVEEVSSPSLRERFLNAGRTFTLANAEEIGKALEAIQQANAAYDGAPVQRINESAVQNRTLDEQCVLQAASGFRAPVHEPDSFRRSYAAAGLRHGVCAAEEGSRGNKITVVDPFATVVVP
ncbi:hypothetical protein HPB52_003456 [Rhipicephalus sanguineus]|uniref:Retrotransposon gag domain-containing protein n=1 Tax=Rhipicephalus sanguineus TaxID=34632 RepID=A0A9D4STI3_RHISA|nr:hypothetical protein HPB52_003456 [Rhipicephalus sanguineus]